MKASLTAGKLAEIVVAAVDNGGGKRIFEYTPWPDIEVMKGGGGGAAKMLAWYETAVLPTLAKKYRLLKGRQHRVIAGSSLGGLLSMYALLTRSAVYGGAIAMSGSWWWSNGKMLDFANSKLPLKLPVRLWLDAGTVKDGLANTLKMKKMCLSKGFMPGKDLGYYEHPGGKHNEASWSKRMHLPLRFFFDPGDREAAF